MNDSEFFPGGPSLCAPEPVVGEAEAILAARREPFEKQYLELVGRADAPQPGDAELLANLIERLNLDPRDVRTTFRTAAVIARAKGESR